VGMNMACFNRQSTITRIVSELEKEGSFSMKLNSTGILG